MILLVKDNQLPLKRWWQSMMLSPYVLKEKNILPAPTHYKARLKRCDSIEAAQLTEGFRALWFSLPEEARRTASARDWQRWAMIAAALVYVTSDSSLKLAVAAGQKKESDKSLVSEMRFNQLQSATDPDEFLRRLRRILKQIKGEVAVIPLAKDIGQWLFEYYELRPREASERINVQWAMDYYGAAN